MSNLKFAIFSKSIFCLLLVGLALPAFALEAGQEILSPRAAAQLLEKEGVALVDVRTPSEYAEGHIEGAVNLNFFGPRFEEELGKLPKDRPILLYCKTGVRSARAAEMFRDVGFEKVYDLGGGISAWTRTGLPLIKGEGK